VVAGLKGLRPAREVPVDDVIYKELTIGVPEHAGRGDLPRGRDRRDRPPPRRPGAHALAAPRASRGRGQALAGEIRGMNPLSAWRSCPARRARRCARVRGEESGGRVIRHARYVVRPLAESHFDI